MTDPESENQDPFVTVAIADLKISSEDYPTHSRQVAIFLEKDESIGAEFKLVKSQWAAGAVGFLGLRLRLRWSEAYAG